MDRREINRYKALLLVGHVRQASRCWLCLTFEVYIRQSDSVPFYQSIVDYCGVKARNPRLYIEEEIYQRSDTAVLLCIALYATAT